MHWLNEGHIASHRMHQWSQRSLEPHKCNSDLSSLVQLRCQAISWTNADLYVNSNQNTELLFQENISQNVFCKKGNILLTPQCGGLIQERHNSIANALEHWSYVFLALTHRKCYYNYCSMLSYYSNVGANYPLPYYGMECSPYARSTGMLTTMIPQHASPPCHITDTWVMAANYSPQYK